MCIFEYSGLEVFKGNVQEEFGKLEVDKIFQLIAERTY